MVGHLFPLIFAPVGDWLAGGGSKVGISLHGGLAPDSELAAPGQAYTGVGVESRPMLKGTEVGPKSILISVAWSKWHG